MPTKYAVNIDGTIGVGKSTLGRAMSQRFDGAFLDGDDFKMKGKPWYCSSLSTCRRIREAAICTLDKKSIVFISRPMRCLDWVYFSQHFQRLDIHFLSVGLQAPFKTITSSERGRLFSKYELERMAAMIQEGYGARPYSDLHVNNDKLNIDATVASFETSLRKLIEK